jgi:hypothetical protein
MLLQHVPASVIALGKLQLRRRGCELSLYEAHESFDG